VRGPVAERGSVRNHESNEREMTWKSGGRTGAQGLLKRNSVRVEEGWSRVSFALRAGW
jgi:hypothetical protein